MVIEDLTMGGEHTVQYTDDGLYNCTPEIYIINQCHPNKFNKKVLKTSSDFSSHWE